MNDSASLGNGGAVSPPVKRRSGIFSFLAGLSLAIAAVAALAFYGPPQIKDALRDFYLFAYGSIYPCTRPETYSFGTFDPRFKISKATFASAMTEAEETWETAVGRDLFAHVDTGGALTVNLIYDYRQEATDKLRGLGIVIGDDRATYDRLRKRLDALDAKYKPLAAKYDSEAAALDERKAAYDREVAKWNARGGAPEEEYARLQKERDAINAEVARINAQGKTLKAMIDEINSVVTVINRLATKLNLAASNYNGVVAARGEEFSEGLFTGTAAGGTIDIYEFENRAKLVRVLAHELGHALGLEHLDDPNAIMYYLNSGATVALSLTDVVALEAKCGIRK